MAILVNKETRLIVQGLTGREGTFHAKACAAYGTQVVGGVTPGKGGTTHEGWPIFNTVLEAMEKECGLTQRNVPYMRPEPPNVADGYAQTKITLRLEGISEDQMKQVLKRIQSADLPMGVRSLELRTSRKTPGLLDATIEVVSVTPAGKG